MSKTMRIYSNEMGTIQENASLHITTTDDVKSSYIELIRTNKTTGKIDTFKNPVVADVAYQFVKHADVASPENKLIAFIASLHDVAFNPADDCLDDDADDYLDKIASLDVDYLDADTIQFIADVDAVDYDDYDDCLDDCLDA